jgi:DNA ligase-1
MIESVTPMLAHTYSPSAFESGARFVASEKLDGIRAIWTGSKMYARSSIEIQVPPRLLATLPSGVALDGELWCGRNLFHQTISTVRKKQPPDGVAYFDWSAAWQDVKYMVFDEYGSVAPWRERFARATQAIHGSPFAQPHYHFEVGGQSEFDAFYDHLIGLGAEGAMLRRIDQPYEFCRTRSLLKRKPTIQLHAVVVGHQPGAGKHAGRLGALICRLADSGVEFRVGTGFTDEQRESPVAIGSSVVVSCMEKTRAGVPRFPVFERVG